MPIYMQIIINIVFSYVASVGFALTINVPHRALNLAGVSGTVGWMVCWFITKALMGRMLSNLIGAFVIGILGLFFARIKKCPVTVFNIPALVPLVPGVPAYQAVRALVNGNVFDAEASFLRVGIVTCSIALGILLATMFTEMFYRVKKFYKKRKIKL